jgi:hypothetical protein
MLNICVRQNTFQNVVLELVRCAAAVLILMFCAIAGSSLCAQDRKPSEQPTTAPPVEQKSPSPTPTASPTVAASATSSAHLNIDQIRANLPVAPADRFEFLRRQRKITLEAIEDASLQLKTLTTNISSLQQRKKDALAIKGFVGISPDEKKRAAADLDQAKQALGTAQNKRPPSETEVKQLQADVRKKEDILTRIDSFIKASEKRQQDAADIAKTVDGELSQQIALQVQTAQSQSLDQRLLGEIDDMVNQLFISSDATNSFKLKMSIAFAGLVAVVIAGFFWIAFSNEEVKKAIFSNEAGIQFITLFAIVIAVILFGIIGILEGKELAALLGGLSGYILGKTRA